VQYQITLLKIARLFIEAGIATGAQEALDLAIRNIKPEPCPKCGGQCGYWNLPLGCGK